MGFWGWTILIVVAFIAIGILVAVLEEKKEAKMSPAQRDRYRKKKAENSATFEYGPVQRQVICPHCNTKGKVHTKTIKQKKGVSGGKATAALLTGGISMLATGLSRKEASTQAHCRNCDSTWFF